MEPTAELHSWEELENLLEKKDRDQLEAYLEAMNGGELVRAIFHLNREDQLRLLNFLSPDFSASIIEEIPDTKATELIEQLSATKAASIINEMWSDDQADLLGSLKEARAEAILAKMDPEEAAGVRKLISYKEDTAGGLMVTEYLAFPETATVGDVIQDMNQHAEEYADYHLQYIYVIAADGKLVGVLRMRDLLLTRPSTPITRIMIRKILTISATDMLDELLNFFDDHDFLGAPVVNEDFKLVGVLLRKDIMEAEGERSDAELLRLQGIVGGEELRTMPLKVRSGRRLSWLSLNIVLNIISASVIALYQDTLSSVIALAVFLPIISDMSGCSGNQAVAVSMRELSLNIIRPTEVLRVLWQEMSVGLINGLVLGMLVGLGAWWWKGNPYLGLVAGGALAINTIIAVALGGSIPLLLKRIGMDPALASSPILTTITDMVGFLLVLGFATLMLPLLI